MKNLPDYLKRGIRTLIQLVASGGLTALVDKLAGGLDPSYVALVLSGWQVVVTLAQNWLEDNTAFPAVLKKNA